VSCELLESRATVVMLIWNSGLRMNILFVSQAEISSKPLS